MKYDDASWHSGGEGFPDDSPDEFGGTHIALFLKWCFTKGWAGAMHKEETPEELQKVIDGNMFATDYFFKNCDGKLTDEDFNDTGNAFATKYYGDRGLYFNDYAQHFYHLMYCAPENSHDFEKFSSILEERFKSGVLEA